MLDVEMTVRFKGRVQGVGFRASARAFAAQFNIRGYARNLSDGSVEICAQGTKENLDFFLGNLREKFRKNGIEETQFELRSCRKIYDDFKVG